MFVLLLFQSLGIEKLFPLIFEGMKMFQHHFLVPKGGWRPRHEVKYSNII